MLCNDIWTNLIIRTAEDDVETRSDRALVKIVQTQNSIKIYVPSDEAGLYSSLRTELPLDLSLLLGITHAGAAKQVYRVLNDEASTLDAIMDDEDIPQVAWLEKPPDSRQYWRSQDSTMPSLPGQIQDSPSVTPNPLENLSLPEPTSSSPPPAYPDDEILLDRSVGNRVEGYGLYPGGIIQQVVQKNAYRQILQNVVKQARQVSLNGHGTDFGPSGSDAFSMSNLAAALEDLEPTALRRRFGLSGDPSARFAETSKLGAAGELYVSGSIS